MQALLFDLDGVFYENDMVIPGAPEVVTWVRQQKIPHLFLTNTTSRDRNALCGKLAGYGIQVSEEQLLTPPLAACAWLRQNVSGKIALFVPEAIRAEFNEFSVADQNDSKVEAVILGDMGEQWSYALLNCAFRLLMQSPPVKLIALGMTRYWRADDGLRLDVAPFVTALQHATGIEPIVLGKPSTDFYNMAVSLLNVPHEQVVMIGDDIRSDIEGAQNSGLNAILVRTGKFQESDLQQGIQSDAVLNSVAELPGWWQTQ